MFASLHNHTDYSVLDSLMTSDVLFATAKDYNYSAVAVTEHRNLSSLFVALKASHKTGIKYIPGIEFDIKDSDADDYPKHLVVLAANLQGLKSIMKTCYLSYNRSINSPYLLWEDLGQLDNNGIFVLSGCCDGLLAVKTLLYGVRAGENIVDKFLLAFGDRFFIEVNVPFNERQKDVNDLLLDIASRKGVPSVVGLDSHFKDKEDEYLFRVLLAIQNKGSIYSTKSSFYTRPHMMREEEIRALMKGNCGAVDATVELANSCDDPREYLRPSSGFLMPNFDVQKMPDYDEFIAWRKGRQNG